MKCEKCGEEYEIGEWPYCPHGMPRHYEPFHPWLDEHIGHEPQLIDSLAKWNRLMKQNKMELRDRIPKGELSSRRDRARQMEKERRHAS